MEHEKKAEKMKKNDWLLLAVVLFAAAVIFLLRAVLGDQHPGYVTVRVNGEIEETFDLSEDVTAELNGGTNILQIQGGVVDMTDADCPDRLCVNQRPISSDGESIICLPNQVVVQIVSQDESELDAVAN